MPVQITERHIVAILKAVNEQRQAVGCSGACRVVASYSGSTVGRVQICLSSPGEPLKALSKPFTQTEAHAYLKGMLDAYKMSPQTHDQRETNDHE